MILRKVSLQMHATCEGVHAKVEGNDSGAEAAIQPAN